MTASTGWRRAFVRAEQAACMSPLLWARTLQPRLPSRIFWSQAVAGEAGGGAERRPKVVVWRSRSLGFETPPLTQPPRRGGFVDRKRCGRCDLGRCGPSRSSSPYGLTLLYPCLDFWT